MILTNTNTNTNLFDQVTTTVVIIKIYIYKKYNTSIHFYINSFVARKLFYWLIGVQKRRQGDIVKKRETIWDWYVKVAGNRTQKLKLKRGDPHKDDSRSKRHTNSNKDKHEKHGQIYNIRYGIRYDMIWI